MTRRLPNRNDLRRARRRDPFGDRRRVRFTRQVHEPAFRKAPEPRPLPLGKPPRADFHLREQLRAINFARQERQRLAVANRLTRGPAEPPAVRRQSSRRHGPPVDNHLHGHVASLFLGREAVEPPFVCLLASGGHTLLLDVRDRGGFRVVGTTLDDAAGEAFDKGARLLGLGYPGGAAIDRLAQTGDPEAYRFPVARVPGLDFSFSGLKTALLYAVRELPPRELERRRADLAASYQRAIVRALVERAHAALGEVGTDRLAVVGGVAANSELRARLAEDGAVLAPLELCTDNAAMIGSAARFVQRIPFPGYLGLDAYASSS